MDLQTALVMQKGPASKKWSQQPVASPPLPSMRCRRVVNVTESSSEQENSVPTQTYPHHISHQERHAHLPQECNLPFR